MCQSLLLDWSFLECDTVIVWVVSNNLKDHGAFIFFDCRHHDPFDTSGTTCQMTWHHIPGGLSHMQCGYENLKSCSCAVIIPFWTEMNVGLQDLMKDPEYQILSVCNRGVACVCKMKPNKIHMILIEDIPLCLL